MKIKYLLLVLIVLLINSIAWASGNKCLPNEDSIHVKATRHNCCATSINSSDGPIVLWIVDGAVYENLIADPDLMSCNNQKKLVEGILKYNGVEFGKIKKIDILRDLNQAGCSDKNRLCSAIIVTTKGKKKKAASSAQNGDGLELVDVLMRYSIVESKKPDMDIDSVINRIVGYAERDTRPDIKALLYYLSAKILYEYRIKIINDILDSRPIPVQTDVRNSSIKTYSSTQIDSLIREYVSLSLINEEELFAKPLTNYAKIINLGSDICPSLYHFLALEGYGFVGHDEELLKHLLDRCEQGSAFHMQVILRTANRLSADYYAKLLDRSYIKEEWGICMGYYEIFKDNENCGAFLKKLMVGLGSFYLGEEYLSRFPNSIYAPAIANRVNSIKRETLSVYANNEYYSNDSLLVQLEGFHVDDVVLRSYRLKDYYNVNRLGLYNLSDFILVDEIKDKMNSEFNLIKDIAFPPQETGRYIILPSFLSKDGEWVNPETDFKCPSLIEVNDKTRPSGVRMFNNHEYLFVLRSTLPEPKEETPITLPSLNTYGDLWFSNDESKRSI